MSKETDTTLEFAVDLDVETDYIFRTDSQIILRQLFQNDPNQVFLLENTGFSMGKQLETWINATKASIKDNTSLEKMQNIFVSKTIQDVLGFYFEYLSGQDVFPIQVEFIEDIDSNKTVYASKYSQTLESVTLPNERDGALAEGVKKVVKLLIDSGPETIVFLPSPSGWSGLGHTHPASQTYAYWINENGNLDALTIRTDISLDINEKLVQVDGKNNSLKERIKNVVSSPQCIHANSFDAVLDLIEEASGHKFQKQRDEIKNYKQLFTLNDEAENIVNNLKSDLLNNISHLNLDSIKIFAELVGKAILDLRKQVLDTKHKKEYVASGVYTEYQYASWIDMYEQLAIDVQQQEGCNGGGGDSQSESLLQQLFKGVDGNPKYVENCGVCGISIKAFIASGYQCPSCKQIYLGC